MSSSLMEPVDARDGRRDGAWMVMEGMGEPPGATGREPWCSVVMEEVERCE